MSPDVECFKNKTKTNTKTKTTRTYSCNLHDLLWIVWVKIDAVIDDVVLGDRLELLLNRLSLATNEARHVEVIHSRVQHAMHESTAVVVLDETLPPIRQPNFAREALLLKVAHGKVVGKGEKVHHVDLAHRLLEVIHHVRAVATHLLGGRDGAKGNLHKVGERTKADAANHTPVCAVRGVSFK